MSAGVGDGVGPRTGPRCENVRRLLPLFVGDDLDRSMSRTVSGHLVDCVTCRGEAAALQQSRKLVVAVGDVVPPEVDAAMFEDLHERTMAAVEAEAVAAGGFESGGYGDGGSGLGWGPSRLPLLARGLWAAAAGLLFWLGWWSVSQPEEPAPFGQPVPAARSLGEGSVVVPWSGRRAVMRPLEYSPDADGYGAGGFDDAADGSGIGSGMMARWNLRNLEEEDVRPGFERGEAGGDTRIGEESRQERAKSRAAAGNDRSKR